MKFFCIIYIAFFTFSISNAQKLPNTQKTGVKVPIGIKIDGNIDEWGNKFQALNRATEILYSIANDDKSLYLSVQITNADIINKVVAGGLSFIIPNSGKKSEKSIKSITFPAYDTPNKKSRIRFNRQPVGKNDETYINDNNNILATNCKYINTTGIYGLDSLLSIYNTEGVKAACKFDIKKFLNIEIAIPLKLFGLSETGLNKFAYHILLSGAIPIGEIKFVKVEYADGRQVTDADVENMKSRVVSNDAKISSPTDFWGEYTLAK